MNLFKYASSIFLLVTAVACQAQSEPGPTKTAVPTEALFTAAPSATVRSLPERPDPLATAVPEAEPETANGEAEREVDPEIEGDTTVIQVSVSEPFTLQVRETAVYNQTTLTFLEVSEDSRCPKSVTCVWEGQGIVEVEMSSEAGQVIHIQFNTNPPDDILIYNQIEIQMTELAPYPQTPDPIPQEAYEAVFVINEVTE